MVVVVVCDGARVRLMRIVSDTIRSPLSLSPTGFKCGIDYRAPISPHPAFAPHNKSVTAVSNTTAISSSFARITRNFDLLFSQKAFVHHYLDSGMEEGELLEAREDLASLQNDFEDMQSHEDEEDDDLGDEY